MAKSFGDMGGLMKQAQQMQAEIKRIRAELKDRVVEGKAGGEAVIAYANGAQELVSIKIQPEVLDPDEVEDLEDLVLAAVRAALGESRKMADEEMSRVTGGMGKLPFGM